MSLVIEVEEPTEYQQEEMIKLENKLYQLQQLQTQFVAMQQRQQQLQDEFTKLENHRVALEYIAGEENNRRIADARDAARLAQLNVQELEKNCRDFALRCP